jgi:primary-amine oxidase
MAEADKDYKPRTDIKPLHIVQPEGVSFKMNGHELEWQNWKMHIGKQNKFPRRHNSSNLFSS